MERVVLRVRNEKVDVYLAHSDYLSKAGQTPLEIGRRAL